MHTCVDKFMMGTNYVCIHMFIDLFVLYVVITKNESKNTQKRNGEISFVHLIACESVPANVCICMYVCMYVCESVPANVCICMYVCMYVCM